MAKKKPKMIMTIPVGGPLDKIDVEIWNDIHSVRCIGLNKVELIRDNNSWVTTITSSDAAGINKVYAVAVAIIAGRNYGA